MLIKFFKRRSFKERNADEFRLGFEKKVHNKSGSAKATYHRKSRGARAAVNYLLGEKRDREGARLLRGSPELSIKIAEQADRKFETPYTVGCLAIEERELTAEQKNQIMDSFEALVFAGISPENRNVLWVEHTDKRNLELNFFIPNMELSTGKRFQPYYHQADKQLFADWSKAINKEYGLSDPTDLSRKQIQPLNKYLPKGVKEISDEVHTYISSAVERGEIKNRKEVIERINQDFEPYGIKVVRVSKQSISINNPDGKRNIRLKGKYYEHDFGIGRTVEGQKSEDRRTGESNSSGGRGNRSSVAREGTEATNSQSRYGGVSTEAQRGDEAVARHRERLYRAYEQRIRSHQRNFQSGGHELSEGSSGTGQRGYKTLSLDHDRYIQERGTTNGVADQKFSVFQAVDISSDTNVGVDGINDRGDSHFLRFGEGSEQQTTSYQRKLNHSGAELSGAKGFAFAQDVGNGGWQSTDMVTKEEQSNLSSDGRQEESECIGSEEINEELEIQKTVESNLIQLERKTDDDELER